MSDEPTRWIEDGEGVPEGLVDDLRVAAEVPFPFDADAGLARLREGIDAAHGPTGGVSGGGLVVALLGLGALIGLGAWGWSGRAAEGSPKERPVVAAPLEDDDAPEDPPLMPPEVASEVEEPQPSADPAPSTMAVQRTARERAAPPSEERAADPSAEIRHLARLRALLASDPRRAVRHANAGDRRFPDGLFSEERAALRVQALASAGDPSAAAAGRRFLQQHPDSPHRDAVLGALETPR